MEHVFRVFSKELESDTLADLRQSISDNLSSLLSESEQQAELNRAFVAENINSFAIKSYRSKFTQPSRPQRQQTRRQPQNMLAAQRSNSQKTPCKYCLAVKPAIAFTHSLQNCFELQRERLPSARATAVTDIDHKFTTYDNDDANSPLSEDKVDYEEEVSVNSCSTTVTDAVVKINRVNITESPILTCTAASIEQFTYC